MVWYHMGRIGGNNSSYGNWDIILNSELNYIFDAMGYFVISYFFAVTGFLLFYNLTYKSYTEKIKRRFFSLLIPYILWQIIPAVIGVLRGQYTFKLSDFLLSSFGMVRYPLNGPLWFVYAIFIMSLFSPILLFLFKNRKVGWCLILCITVFIQANGYEHIPDSKYLFPNIVYYLPSYLVGAFCGMFIKDIKFIGLSKYILSICLLAFLLAGLLPTFLGSIIIKTMPFVLVFLFPFTGKLKDKEIYNLTFLIYAFHGILPYRSISNDIVHKFFKMHMPISILNITERVTGLLLVAMVSALVYTITKKYAPKILAILSGGRSL